MLGKSQQKVLETTTLRIKNVQSSAFYEVISSANKDDIVIDNTFYAFYVTCSDIVAMKPEEEEKKQDDFVTLKHFNDRVYRNNSTDNIIKSTPFDIKIISTIKTRHVTSKHIDQKKQSLYLLYKKFPDPRILPVFMLNKTTLHKSDIFRSNNLSYNNVESSNCTIDILFLIDLSSKTKSYIGDYLHSILIILSKAVISKKKIQVSVVSFSPTKKQSLLFAFAKHNTLLSISEKLNYLVNDDNDDSNPNMKDTLAFLFSFFNSQTSQYNVRQSAKKKVVILTQGYFNDEHYNNNILEEVEKLKNNHVEIFSVSIKNKKKNIWPPKNLGIFMSYPDRIFIRKIIPTSCIFEMSA
uniref:VWFA domain-containing protein n=1 Tax=Parastrongyloides trichosuri TaxID=131310 RepID=A0A0N5A2U9_PARTI